ncbi:MAG: SDR family oxidoreductase [Salinarimonadaceae bacterium]|nr:MAG: SDR family oxidoreductase [Salinarimonadaceae bacterium]
MPKACNHNREPSLNEDTKPLGRSSDRRRRVLVAGGAGFLGSHLCDRLITLGNEVICVDSLLTGSVKNIDHLFDSGNFHFIQHDVIDPIKIEVDEIYNLACAASPPRYQNDPVHTTKTCVIGAINLLNLAVSCNAKIFQASTSEVYGDPQVHPQPESYWGNVNSFGPRACYDEGKRCAETLFFDYHARHGVDTRIARIFNTYGPRMSPQDGRVVSNFIVQALHGDDITIYGDGLQTRSFCYIDDLIDGVLRLMNVSEAPAGPVNLGNPVEFNLRELAELVLDLTGSPSRFVQRPLPVDDPRQRRPDIALAERLLDWRPGVSLQEGLQRTVAHFERELSQRRTAPLDMAEAVS